MFPYNLNSVSLDPLKASSPIVLLGPDVNDIYVIFVSRKALELIVYGLSELPIMILNFNVLDAITGFVPLPIYVTILGTVISPPSMNEGCRVIPVNIVFPEPD